MSSAQYSMNGVLWQILLSPKTNKIDREAKFFVLGKTHLQIFKDKKKQGRLKKQIELSRVQAVELLDAEVIGLCNTFQVISWRTRADSRTLYIQTGSSRELEEWVDAIRMRVSSTGHKAALVCHVGFLMTESDGVQRYSCCKKELKPSEDSNGCHPTTSDMGTRIDFEEFRDWIQKRNYQSSLKTKRLESSCSIFGGFSSSPSNDCNSSERGSLCDDPDYESIFPDDACSQIVQLLERELRSKSHALLKAWSMRISLSSRRSTEEQEREPTYVQPSLGAIQTTRQANEKLRPSTDADCVRPKPPADVDSDSEQPQVVQDVSLAQIVTGSNELADIGLELQETENSDDDGRDKDLKRQKDNELNKRIAVLQSPGATPIRIFHWDEAKTSPTMEPLTMNLEISADFDVI